MTTIEALQATNVAYAKFCKTLDALNLALSVDPKVANHPEKKGQIEYLMEGIPSMPAWMSRTRNMEKWLNRK